MKVGVNSRLPRRATTIPKCFEPIGLILKLNLGIGIKGKPTGETLAPPKELTGLPKPLGIVETLDLEAEEEYY